MLSRLNRTALALAVYPSSGGLPTPGRKTRLPLLARLYRLGFVTHTSPTIGFQAEALHLFLLPQPRAAHCRSSLGAASAAGREDGRSAESPATEPSLPPSAPSPTAGLWSPSVAPRRVPAPSTAYAPVSARRHAGRQACAPAPA